MRGGQGGGDASGTRSGPVHIALSGGTGGMGAGHAPDGVEMPTHIGAGPEAPDASAASAAGAGLCRPPKTALATVARAASVRRSALASTAAAAQSPDPPSRSPCAHSLQRGRAAGDTDAWDLDNLEPKWRAQDGGLSRLWGPSWGPRGGASPPLGPILVSSNVVAALWAPHGALVGSPAPSPGPS